MRCVQPADPKCLYKTCFKITPRRQLEAQLRNRFANRAYELELEAVLKFAVNERTIVWNLSFLPRCCVFVASHMALCEQDDPPQRTCNQYCPRAEALRSLHLPNHQDEAIPGTSGTPVPKIHLKREHPTIHQVSESDSDAPEEADPLEPSRAKALMLQTSLLPKE